MKNKISVWSRIISSIVILISSIGIYKVVSDAGKEMILDGYRMSRLRSVGGESLAEAYYQIHGEIYASMGEVLVNSVFLVLIAGILIAIWIIYPVIVEKISETSPVTSNEKTFCTQCGAELISGTEFCTQCGKKNDNMIE